MLLSAHVPLSGVKLCFALALLLACPHEFTNAIADERAVAVPALTTNSDIRALVQSLAKQSEEIWTSAESLRSDFEEHKLKQQALGREQRGHTIGHRRDDDSIHAGSSSPLVNGVTSLSTTSTTGDEAQFRGRALSSPSPSASASRSSSTTCESVDNGGVDLSLLVDGIGQFTADLLVGANAESASQSIAELHAAIEEISSARDWMCVPLTMVDVVSVLQKIDTKGAMDWEYFEMGGDSFLAVANFNTGPSFITESVIYRFSKEDAAFKVFQEITTEAIRDFEHFAIDGIHYLVSANQLSDIHYNTTSILYRYNESVSRFQQFQVFATYGGTSWESFSINGSSFIAVTNMLNGSSYDIPSEVYRFNSSTDSFELYQQIITHGAVQWKHFEIHADHFLVVANHYNGTSYLMKSVVYRYNNTAAKFEPFQVFDTLGALAWEHFTMNGTDFLALANHFDGGTHDISSFLFWYNAATAKFEVYQEFAEIGASDWEYFQIGDHHFLALANYILGNSIVTESNLYLFNAVTSTFDVARTIKSMGAIDWKYFTIGSDAFLALANFRSETSYELESAVFKLNSFCLA